jgi:NADH-quinone oxidoreductase subunit J
VSDTLFYILAGGLVLFSLLAATVPNLLHAAIALITSFFLTAAIYIMLQMEFVALSQIMLYIGGIVIFILIIILLTTGLGTENRFKVPINRRLYALLVSAVLLVSLLATIFRPLAGREIVASKLNNPVSIDAIGHRLLATDSQGFIVPFELISLLLLAALIGSVVVARKDKKEGK